MEIAFKCLKFGICCLFFHICSAYPINSEVAAVGQHNQVVPELIAILLTICSIVVLAGCLCCQRRNQFKKFHDSPVVASISSDLDHGHVNPIANGEFTIFTPLSVSNYNNNIFLTNNHVIAQSLRDQQEGLDLNAWFNASEKDFPRIKLKYIKELGRGWFGKVVEGAAQDLGDNKQAWTPVVVRILDATCSQKEKILFLQDAAIYRCGSHPNILSLTGRCLDTVPFLLLQEYCPQGNLKAYLRYNKTNAEKLLSTEYPLIWCCQLTSALNHLHKNHVAHIDLAARNCQLTSNLTLKLGDYGLGLYLYPSDYYQNSLGVPLRWCAPESLEFTQTTVHPKVATPESNVWSLGVTMWEICECGEQPYSNFSDDEVISKVFGPSNVRLERPRYSVLYTDYIYRLMQLCWTTNAESRPKVNQIDLMLSDLLQVHRHTANSTSNYDDDFDQRWQSLKPNYIVKTDHISDSVSVEIHDSDILLAPSISNIHGSLNNLLVENGPPVECYIDDELGCELKKPGKRYVLEVMSSSDSDTEVYKNRTKIGKSEESQTNPFHHSSSLNRMSSGSETEDENWHNKVERGAYTEKVRLKSRSVADLMVLTHVDYSESESETPLPSLDYRINYKNVRLAPNNNLENVSITYGSEGNLLNIENTFQEELRKLKEERRDSLLFVPDNNSHSIFDNQQELNNNASVVNSSRLMKELNDGTEIKPVNQVYNVFNVTIEKFSPIHSKLKDIIFNDDLVESSIKNSRCDNKLGNISTNNFSFQNQEQKDNSQAYRDEVVQASINLVDEVIADANYSLSKHIEQDRETDTNAFRCSSEEILEIYPEIIPVNEEFIIKKEGHSDSGVVSVFKMVSQASVVNLADLETEKQTANSASESSMTKAIPTNLSRNDSYNNLNGIPEILNDNNLELCIVHPDPKLLDSLLQATDSQGSNKSSGYSSEHEILEQELAELTVHPNNKNLDVPIKVVDNIDTEDETVQMNSIADIKNDESHLTNIKVSEEETVLDKGLLEYTNVNKVHNSECIEEKSHQQDVVFDLSSNQEHVMPNSLTHSGIFSSTPFRKKEISLPLLSDNDYTSINLYSVPPDAETGMNCEKEELNYSLETWDNFLGKTLDQSENLFGSFSSEPQSLLFVDNGADHISSNVVELAPEKDRINNVDVLNEVLPQNSSNNANDSEVNPQDELNRTFSKNNAEVLDQSLQDYPQSWENSGGWFLHPQTSNEDPVGEMQIQPVATDSYVGFGIDDEIMSAIRNELLSKLPHAQGASSERVNEDSDWDTGERNEVFLKYNVYNTPLSPIPEESFGDDVSTGTITPKLQNENIESDWSEPCEPDVFVLDTESTSALTHESPYKGPSHRHTPSQDSCCSNDTLFNLEELICVVSETEKNDETSFKTKNERTEQELVINDGGTSENLNLTFVIEPADCDEVSEEATLNCELQSGDRHSLENKSNWDVVIDFIWNEKKYSSQHDPYLKANLKEKSNILFPMIQTVPLPSPEDNPWKQLTASLLNYDKVTAQMTGNLESANDIVPDYIDIIVQDVAVSELSVCKIEESEFVGCEKKIEENGFDNDLNDSNNLIHIENAKNASEYGPFYKEEELSDEENLYGVLTDIRFNGPGDNQLMSTSFSESNNCDEQDWDSGSDSRSSSSGEFIWKEGEHEESLKALRAAPQDVVDDVKPMESIAENANQESDISSSFSDEDGEIPEFIPSAWDKFATPGKSALRSPEKTLQTDEKKTKGVWFKKQKYHCIYEYPREPDSPVLQSQDLWKAQSATDYQLFADWEFDGETYLPPSTDEHEIQANSIYSKPKNITRNLYQLSNLSDVISSDGDIDNEFYISSSSQPFNLPAGLNSQFFPGNGNWVDNATPDSGIEDPIAPNSLNDNIFLKRAKIVPSLKQLALDALNKTQLPTSKHIMGGLRHTKNKLKLDLPPSPSAFTSDKLFTIELTSLEPVIRKKPTFTTFGKSRFLVQHVDTPPDESKCKNVSFEALPYKPPNTELKSNIYKQLNESKVDSTLDRSIIKAEDSNLCKLKIEVVRGEASLLDSADEDSGIESSTLERKLDSSKLF